MKCVPADPPGPAPVSCRQIKLSLAALDKDPDINSVLAEICQVLRVGFEDKIAQVNDEHELPAFSCGRLEVVSRRTVCARSIARVSGCRLLRFQTEAIIGPLSMFAIRSRFQVCTSEAFQCTRQL